MPIDPFFQPRDNRIKVKRHTPKSLAIYIYQWFCSHRCTASVAVHQGELYIVPSGKKNQDKLIVLPGYIGTYALGPKRLGVTYDMLLDDACALPESIQQQFDGRAI